MVGNIDYNYSCGQPERLDVLLPSDSGGALSQGFVGHPGGAKDTSKPLGED